MCVQNDCQDVSHCQQQPLFHNASCKQPCGYHVEYGYSRIHGRGRMIRQETENGPYASKPDCQQPCSHPGRRNIYVHGFALLVGVRVGIRLKLLLLLLRLLLLITQGKVITFDERTHRRKLKATLRLTYIFLAARLFEKEPLEAIQADILAHLERAQDQLAQIWGTAELERLHNTGQTLSHLTEDWQTKLAESAGRDLIERAKEQPLDQLSPSDRQQLVFSLGKFAQNRLYRHILLDKISELWVEYLTRVEALRVSVRMEAYGQKDPLVSYKGQASEMFSNLLSDIRAGVIDQMFRVRLVRKEDTGKVQSAPQRTSANGTASGDQKKSRKKSRKRH